MLNIKTDRSELIALVDADTFLYTAAHGADRSIEWEPDLWTVTGDMAVARAAFAASLEAFEGFGRVIPFLSKDKEKYWRRRALPTYKANRTQGRVPFLMEQLKLETLDTLAESYGGIVYTGEEADDLIGIYASGRDDTVVFSADKDLKQIPGLHGDFHDPTNELVTVDAADGHRLWLMQALMGDPTDNYVGIPGVGKVTAEKLLTEPTIETVFEIFEKKKQTREQAHIMLSMARILQSPWDIMPNGLVDLDYLTRKEAELSQQGD